MHCRERIGHGLQWLVVDVDPADRVSGHLRGFGQDERDGLSREYHLVPGKRLVHAAVVDPGDWQIASRQDRDDARGGERRRRVHRPDERMGVRRQDRTRVEDADRGSIGGVADRPADLRLGVRARTSSPDGRRLGHRLTARLGLLAVLKRSLDRGHSALSIRLSIAMPFQSWA